MIYDRVQKTHHSIPVNLYRKNQPHVRNGVQLRELETPRRRSQYDFSAFQRSGEMSTGVS